MSILLSLLHSRMGLARWIHFSVSVLAVSYGVIFPWAAYRSTKVRVDCLLTLLQFQRQLAHQLRACERLFLPPSAAEGAPLLGCSFSRKSGAKWLLYRLRRGNLALHCSSGPTFLHWERCFEKGEIQVEAFTVAWHPPRGPEKPSWVTVSLQIKAWNGFKHEGMRLRWVTPLLNDPEIKRELS